MNLFCDKPEIYSLASKFYAYNPRRPSKTFARQQTPLMVEIYREILCTIQYGSLQPPPRKYVGDLVHLIRK